MRIVTHCRALWCVTLLALMVCAGLAQQPEQPPSFKLNRVTAGPRGATVNGEFRLEQERTTFSRVNDTQVVIQFQWDGTPGPHRLGARWRSPTGGVSVSEIEYNAPGPVFGAVWTLPITPSMPLGAWSIESTIDGLPSGSFMFDVVDASTPVPTSAPARLPLALPALYERLESVYVNVERLAARSGLIDQNAGFLIGPSTVATAFSVLDAADTIEVVTRDGRRQRIAAIGPWDRRQDWAIVPVEDRGAPVLPVAPADSTRVGDRCYSMEGGAAGQRVLAECTFIGRTGTDAASAGLVIQFLTGRRVPGAPVLNEFGELVGMVAGPPAVSYRGMPVFRVGSAPGARVLPVSSIRSSGAGRAAPIADLRSRNVLMSAVDGRDHILSGGFAREIQRSGLRPVDQRDEFSSVDKRLFVFLNWDPKERLRGTMIYRVFNEENQTVMESKPRKADFRPGRGAFSQWELPVPQAHGIYRVDVVVGEITVWRGLFRVTP